MVCSIFLNKFFCFVKYLLQNKYVTLIVLLLTLYFYRYLHSRDFASTRPHSFTRVYGNTSTYTPPMLAAETSRLTRRNYTGYTYIGAEHSYDITSRPNSLNNRYRRSSKPR